jgi:hypothetical protein
MKKLKLFFLLIVVSCIIACKASKTATTNTATTTTSTINEKGGTEPFSMLLKPVNNIPIPSNKELIAIQNQFKDVTIDNLNDGYTLYTTGACVNCHSAKNVFEIPKENCRSIIDDMAIRAEITSKQKEALLLYLYAIKATQ